MTLSLTLVIPCYCEASRLVPHAFLALLTASDQVNLLFVDDGSPDDTPAILARLAATRPDRIEVLRLAHNRGKAEAVRRGLLRALEGQVDLVGFWDADLATPLPAVEDFRLLLEQHPDLRWVFGARWRALGRTIARNPVRHYLGRGFATVVSVMLGLTVYDTQCGAKLFRADDLLRRVLVEPFQGRWIFDVEMLARLLVQHRSGTAPDPAEIVYEVPLTAWKHDGKSHVRWFDFFRAFADLVVVWNRYLRHHHTRPFRAPPAPVAGVPPASGGESGTLRSGQAYRTWQAPVGISDPPQSSPDSQGG
jgi:dolichyl-phosphate beta-glucosyltransferase